MPKRQPTPAQRPVPLLLAIAVLLAAALMAGCSSASSEAGTSEFSEADNEEAARRKPKAEQAGPATTRDQFVTLLQPHHDAVKWPAGKDMTTERIWKRMEPVANDTELAENDARSAVCILNMCAWAAEGIENIKANEPTTQAVEGMKGANALANFADGGYENVIESLQLGDVNSLQEFMQANDCDQEFTQ